MGSQYQSFPDARGASQSFTKLKSLLLPDQQGKSFLDVGCNEGFFCALARGDGATRVVGIDANAGVLERARRRFSGIEFRNQSWDDPIEGRFDTILFSSAIHYAKDQPALIAKLMGRLTENGVLVLELGIADQPGDQYVSVERSHGGSCSYATPDALRRVLAAYDVREVGPSVAQRGDPVPRHVLHLRARQAIGRHKPASGGSHTTRSILLFDAPSRSAKSSTVRLLQGGAEPGGVTALSIDGLLIRISSREFRPPPSCARVHAAIVRFRSEQSPRTDLILQMLIREHMLEEFLALVESRGGVGSAPLTLWDGYVPPEGRETVRLFFERRGYRVWTMHPRERFNVARVHLASLRQESASGTTPVPGVATGAGREATLARLKALQLPHLQDKKLLALGRGAEALCELALEAGSVAASVIAPNDTYDVIVRAVGPGEVDGMIALARQMLARLETDGTLVLDLGIAAPRSSKLGWFRPASRRPPGDADHGAILRRELENCVVRRVTTGLVGARDAGPQVLHIQRARPVLMFIEDVCSEGQPPLLAQSGAQGTRHAQEIGMADLRAALETGRELPAAQLLLCRGALPPEQRLQIHLALLDAGWLVWEARERAAVSFAALDIEQAVTRTFPGSSTGSLGEAEIRTGNRAEPVTAWRRLRRISRALLRRLLEAMTDRNKSSSPAEQSADSAGSTAPEAARTPRHGVPVPDKQREAGSPARIQGMLQTGRSVQGGLELLGWAVDTRDRRPARHFVLEIDRTTITEFAVSRRRRARVNARFGLSAQSCPGFVILVPAAVRVDADASVRLGCRANATGEVRWLPNAANFRVTAPAHVADASV